MDSNSRVDSYDSTLGTYASQQINGVGQQRLSLSNGDVGSNGDIDMSQNSAVHGDAVPGPTATASVTGNRLRQRLDDAQLRPWCRCPRW